ncbi:MAG TPA: M20/M25/M40 family metallo-hydrolase, partial [Bryobacteraceae bacterium]|nr:M20/M25/M40 family metallo-hydrolase [Bryobacteraceae bacterium]
MAIFRCKLILLLLAAGAAAQERYPVDWAKVAPETIAHYSALLRLDTTNPPGNETRAAKYLQSVLEREGIPAGLFALDPSRANLVARLKGNGSKQPVLILGHTDTVGVQRENWTVDPFAAIRKNGFIYGRGAQDDKDNAAAGLMLMLLLKRSGVKLDRDVIYLAEAGEEGTTRFGIDFMVSRYWNEISAEFALAEGGAAVSRNGQVRYVQITAAEKVPRQARLVARGTAGHGSRPAPDNPVLHLATAVAKFNAWQPPLRLNEITRTYFERLARVSPPLEAARYRAILDPARAAEADRYFFRNEPGHYTLLRTSITPTVI